MEITFAAGATGFAEARAVSAILRAVDAHQLSTNHRHEVLEQLARVCASELARPEFATSLAGLLTEDGAARNDPETGVWRNLFGPSRRELKLSEQRGEALERAARAERSSFEALAETARVARERDAARARIAELEHELHQTRHGHD